VATTPLQGSLAVVNLTGCRECLSKGQVVRGTAQRCLQKTSG